MNSYKFFNLIFFILFLNSVMGMEVQVLHVKGQVSLENKSVSRGGLAYKKGQVIKTGSSSLVVLKVTKEPLVASFKLNENSELSLDKLGAELIQGNLVRGSLFSKLSKAVNKKGEQLIIKTRNVSMGVRGTQFFVSYGKDQDQWMCVHEGVVVVDVSGDKKLVKAGEGIFIKKGKESTKPKFYKWTEKLNWNLDPGKKLENTLDINSAYTDVLDIDYD